MQRSMKEEYQDRLQRAKNKLNEERARRREEVRDDTSFASGMSQTSRKSYTSDCSRASAKREKGPRSEWRNKAKAVIERGKARKEDDGSVRSRSSVRSSKDRTAEIDSLVERNARLNERERMLKVESDLLNAAEAAEWNDAHITGDEELLDEDKSILSHKSSGTFRTVDSESNKSFHETKAAWQVRCKKEPTSKPTVNDPTPRRSNNSKSLCEEEAENKQTELLNLARSFSFHKKAPGSPGSAKSSRSVRSSRSFNSSRSAKSENVLSRYSKNKPSKYGKYGASAPTSPESTSAKSEVLPRTRDAPSRSKSAVEKLDRNNSYRQSLASSTSRGEERAREDSYRHGSSVSVSSNYSKQSKYSTREEKRRDSERVFPSELSFPVMLENAEAYDAYENGENKAPCKALSTREMSYRERSAMLASMDNNSSIVNESDADEEAPERNMFRQRGQVVKQKNNHRSVLGSKSAVPSVSTALGEKRDFNNTAAAATSDHKKGSSIHKDKKNPLKQRQPQYHSDVTMQMSKLIKENNEMQARLEKEHTRRSELDAKMAQLQLEVHQQKAEMTVLRSRKDDSAAHKEQIYKMEDALQDTNDHMHEVLTENSKLQEALEEERDRRLRLESQSKHYQTKLKTKSDEVVALAMELKRKDDKFTEALVQEQHMRELSEARLAKACLHINNSEKDRNDEIFEVERENSELRHTVHRMEQFIVLQQQQKQQQQQKLAADKTANNSKLRKQSGASLQQQNSWGGTAISEITTDFEYNELNTSQTGEI